jgi:hypothetical protein
MLKRLCDTKLLNDDEDDTKLNNEGNLVWNGRYMSARGGCVVDVVHQKITIRGWVEGRPK